MRVISNSNSSKLEQRESNKKKARRLRAFQLTITTGISRIIKTTPKTIIVTTEVVVAVVSLEES